MLHTTEDEECWHMFKLTSLDTHLLNVDFSFFG